MNIIEVSKVYVDIDLKQDINQRVHETVIRNSLRTPFVLGKNVFLKTQTFFKIYKVENASNIYEQDPLSNIIRISSKISNEAIGSESNLKFISTVDKSVIFPKVFRNDRKLFGFQKIERQLMQYINTKGNRCISLSGPKGYGKAAFLKYLADELEEKIFYTVCHQRMKREEDYLMELWARLEIIRDDIILCIPDFNNFGENEQKLIAEMAQDLQDNERLSIKVILTTSDIDLCKSTIYINYNIVVPQLNDSEIAALIMYLLETPMCSSDSAGTNRLYELVADLRGYSAAYIVNFVHHVSVEEDPMTVDLLIHYAKDSKFIPLQMQKIVSSEITTTWADIGGYDAVKTLLQGSIVKPLLSKQPLYSGVLLYGPPGCSKTMFARALANDCNVKIFEVRPSSVMRSVVGETESAVKEIMNRARAAAPSMIFFDEIETMLPNRASSRGAHVSDRLLSEFLTFLDGVSQDRDQVLFVAATNYLERLDKALVRTGRIDFKIEIGLPDEESRTAILNMELHRLDVAVGHSVWDSLKQISQSLVGYSGSSVVNLCWQFQYMAMEEHESADMDNIVIEMKHVIDVLGSAWTVLC